MPLPDVDHATIGEQQAGTKGVATGREFILLVTALMATTAVGIDLMLPAFPEIRQQFGMASDRFGRRIPLFAGLALYAVSAATAALAPSWQLIVIARFVWGVGAAGPRSLSVAMIRDRYDGDAMARLMSMIMAVFLLVPIVAPGVGAGLIAVLTWRAVFWFPAVVAGLVVADPAEPRSGVPFGPHVGREGEVSETARGAVGLPFGVSFDHRPPQADQGEAGDGHQ